LQINSLSIIDSFFRIPAPFFAPRGVFNGFNSKMPLNPFVVVVIVELF